MYKNANTMHILQWHLLLEEFSPDIEYMKTKETNIARL